jgi:hypothetical protein
MSVNDPKATSLIKRAEAAGHHILIKRVQEGGAMKVSFGCGDPDCGHSAAVNLSSWTARQHLPAN